MDQLHLTHLSFVGLWGGLVMAETVLEVLSREEETLHLASRIHFWIDLLFEIPIILGVTITGLMMAFSMLPLPGLLLFKILLGMIAIAANFLSSYWVILRYRHRKDITAVLRYTYKLRLTGIAIIFGLVTAWMGFRYFS